MPLKEVKTASIPTHHPLQRLASPSTTFSSLIHFLGLSSFGTSYKFLVDNPTPINDSYGWHFQYLTIIGLTLATITFLFGSLADMTSSKFLFRAKNFFSVCAAPMEVLISLLYFSLSAYDKSLVIPDWAQLPLYADLSFHLFPSLFLSLDYLLLSPPWTVSISGALALSGSIATGYWFVVQKCYEHNGFYPYPLFEQLNTARRIVLFTVAALLMAGSTMMLKWLYGKINGKILEVLQAEQDKKKLK